MLKRSILFGLAAVALGVGMNAGAKAATANSSLGAAAAEMSTVTDVRWVCGPYRCAWIPNYAGPVVVYPHMRYWGPPPYPHCYYRRTLFGWKLTCPW